MTITDQDQEHLQILSYCHYGWGIIAGMLVCFQVAILSLAGFLIPGGGPPGFVGFLFAFIAGVAVISGLALAICTLLAGRFLARRKHYVVCMIVAGANCTMMPLGTALGVFTLIVLLRPAVKSMFAQPPPLPRQGAVQQLGL